MNNLLRILFIFVCALYGTRVFAVLHDPTRPPAEQLTVMTNQATPIELNAVVTVDGERFAVINNSIAKIGDEIAGNKIVAIDINTVQLEGMNGKITLFLLGKPIKQAVE